MRGGHTSGPDPPGAAQPPRRTHLCLSSSARSTLARSSARIWSVMTICSTTWWATPGSVFWSRSSSTAPGGQRAERGTPLSAAPGPSPRRTVGQRLAQLQQAAERQRSHVGFPPAVRLLLHVLLKLDPARRLLPLQLLVLVQHQLVQLHEHLRRRGSVGCPAAQRGAAPAPHPAPHPTPHPGTTPTSWGCRSDLRGRALCSRCSLPTCTTCALALFRTRCRRTPGTSSKR